jgi:hypothetical protein
VLGDGGPLVAEFLVQLQKGLVLLGPPAVGDDGGVQVVVVAKWEQGYRSRHCLLLRPPRPNSPYIIRAIDDHFPSPRYSRRNFRMRSSSYDQAFLFCIIYNHKHGGRGSEIARGRGNYPMGKGDYSNIDNHSAFLYS